MVKLINLPRNAIFASVFNQIFQNFETEKINERKLRYDLMKWKF